MASLAVTTSGEAVPPALVTGFAPKYHWRVEGLPAALALNETVAPEFAVRLAGDVTITGIPFVGSLTAVMSSSATAPPWRSTAEVSVKTSVMLVVVGVKLN